MTFIEVRFVVLMSGMRKQRLTMQCEFRSRAFTLFSVSFIHPVSGGSRIGFLMRMVHAGFPQYRTESGY